MNEAYGKNPSEYEKKEIFLEDHITFWNYLSVEIPDGHGHGRQIKIVVYISKVGISLDM